MIPREILKKIRLIELRTSLGFVACLVIALSGVASGCSNARSGSAVKTVIKSGEHRTPGSLLKLARSAESDFAQRFVLGLCLDSIDDEALDAMRVQIQAGRKVFTDGLVTYLETHQDEKAHWVGRILCQESEARAIPVMLQWLQSPDPNLRKMGAFNLCWFPHPDAVPVLLSSIQSETNSETKSQMIVALAQTGDSRGLDCLLAMAHEPHDPEVTGEIVRGLWRIRDPKALPILAETATRLAWLTKTDVPMKSKAPPGSWYLLSETVDAFGHISGSCRKSYAAPKFWGHRAIEPEQIKQGLSHIEQWRKLQGEEQ